MGKNKITDPVFFYAVLICGIAVTQLACRTAYTLFPDAPSQLGSRIIEIIMLIAGIFLWKKTGFVQPGFGMKMPEGSRKKNALFLAALAVISFAVLYAARFAGQLFIPGMAQRPYFGLYLGITHRRYYIFVALIQEILSKSVLQYGIEKTLPKEKWLTGVILSGAVFAMLHVHTSAALMLGAFALSAVSGIYYHFRRDIWATAVVHFIFGFFARSVGLVG